MTAAELPPVDTQAARDLTDRIKVGVEAVWHLITEAYTSRAWAALGYRNWDEYCTREFGTSRLRLPREERAEVVASLRESGLSVRAIVSATGHSAHTVIADIRDRQVLQSATPDPQTPPPTIPQGEPVSRDVGGGSTPEPVLSQEDCEELDDEATDALAERIAAELAASDRDYLGRAHEAVLAALPVVDEPAPRITGIDGKSYPAPEQRKPSRRPITDSFRDATYDLGKKVTTLANLVGDDRFKKNADQLAERNLSELTRARDALQRVIDQLTA